MVGIASQRKGKAGELELMSILRENGFSVQRGGSLSYGKLPDVYGLPGVHIEVKYREKMNPSGFMRQSMTDSQKFHDGMPAVFYTQNGKDWQVAMNLSDWIYLYKKANIESDVNWI